MASGETLLKITDYPFSYSFIGWCWQIRGSWIKNFSVSSVGSFLELWKESSRDHPSNAQNFGYLSFWYIDPAAANTIIIGNPKVIVLLIPLVHDVWTFLASSCSVFRSSAVFPAWIIVSAFGTLSVNGFTPFSTAVMAWLPAKFAMDVANSRPPAVTMILRIASILVNMFSVAVVVNLLFKDQVILL